MCAKEQKCDILSFLLYALLLIYVNSFGVCVFVYRFCAQNKQNEIKREKNLGINVKTMEKRRKGHTKYRVERQQKTT